MKMKADKIVKMLNELVGCAYDEQEVLNCFEKYDEIDGVEDLSITYDEPLFIIVNTNDEYGTIFFIEVDKNNIIEGAWAE